MSEDRRLALLSRLIETLGEEEAKTLMESLPPVLWTHLATKDDLRALEERLRAEFNGKFALILAELSKIQGQFVLIDGKFATIDGKFALIDGEFAKIDGSFTELRGHMSLEIAKAIRTMVFTVMAFSVAIVGTVLGVGLG
ncbi:MAG: hypothetical protein F4Y28_15890 [Acidimicrobiia bacterium]|nr:hypothetical protein [Acidimicrobiia bacterium]MYG59599.1 hypothetical protein [Acidimicrobiia bacterium]MYJ31013.1 hypothetical protein [Acidimicrobiia bacterium]